MGKAERGRWRDNMRAMEIVAKDDADITPDDINFLKENYTGAGGLLPKFMNLGQFFTPPHVARFIVQALNIPPGARVLEPSCGAGAFLEHIPPKCEITGLELDATSARVASLIYPHAKIICGNAFAHTRRDYYDFVVGNPPFGETVEVAGESDLVTLKYDKKRNVSRGKSEFAFVELAIRAARPGGYIALILPLNIGYAKAALKIRQFMRDNTWHIATIKLPPETFQHVGTSVATQILIMRKITPNARLIPAHKSLPPGTTFYEGQQPIFMADVRDIGWDNKGRLTDKWGDGQTQLDVLLEAFTDDYLTRENLFPHEPSWVSADKDVTFAPFFSSECAGMRDAERYYRKEERARALVYWNEMTLGIGEEVEWNGQRVSTFDFGWQDEIVREWYAKEGASIVAAAA